MSKEDSIIQKIPSGVVHSSTQDDQVKALLGFEESVLTNATRAAFNKLKATFNQFQPSFSFGMLFYIYLIGEVRQSLNASYGWTSKSSRMPCVEKDGTRITFSRGNSQVGFESGTPQTHKDYPKSTLALFSLEEGSRLPFEEVSPHDSGIWIYLYRYDKENVVFELSKPKGYSEVKSKTGVIDQWETRIIIDDFKLDGKDVEFLRENAKVIEEELSLIEK